MQYMHLMNVIKRSVVAVVLVLVASAGIFAAEIEFDGELNVMLETAYEYTGKIEFSDIERYFELLANISVEEPDAWYIKLKNEIRSDNNDSLSIENPQYATRFTSKFIDIDLWGEYYDLGADAVLSDPAELLVFGTFGSSALFRQDPAYADQDPKLRATFKYLDQLKAVAQIHKISTGAFFEQTNLELYADYDIDAYNVGGLLRHVNFKEDFIDNSTTAVLFAKTERDGLQIGASVGSRFGDSVDEDAFAFGLSASTDYSEALHLQAQYVQRGAHFSEPAFSSDWLYQLLRFWNTSTTVGTGKGNIVELIATYRGEGDRNGAIPAYVNEDLFEDRSINNFIDPWNAAKFPSLSAQGIVRMVSDESDHAENQLIVRAGFPIAEKLWGAAELSVRSDKDGAGYVAGVDSDEMVSGLAASILYELNDNWDARLSFLRETAHASTNGSWTSVAAWLSHEVGNVTTTVGYYHSTASDEEKAAQQLFAGIQLEF